MSKSGKKTMWQVYKPFLVQYMTPQWCLIMGGILAGVLAAASAGFGLPAMIQYVFPIVFGEEETPAWLVNVVMRWCEPHEVESVVLWVAAAVIPVVMAIRGLATYGNAFLLTKAGMRSLEQLRIDLFTRLQSLSFSFHDGNTRGDLMTRLIQFPQMLQQGMITIMNDLVIQPLTLVAAAGYLVFAACTQHESAMLLGNLIISAGCVPLVRWVGKRMTKLMSEALAGIGVITADVEETLSAQREVRAFNLEKHREELLRSHIRAYNMRLIKMGAWKQSVTPAIEVVSALALAYSLYRGCSDGLTLEQFTAIATAFYFCYDPIKRLGTVANQCQILMMAVEGLNGILNAKDETPEPSTVACQENQFQSGRTAPGIRSPEAGGSIHHTGFPCPV